MAAQTQDIRQYLLEIDKDPKVTVNDVRQKLLNFVDSLNAEKRVDNPAPESPVNHLAVDSALIDEV